MLENLIIFLLGLAIGSFVNVLLYRLRPKSKNTELTGRSQCPKCNKVLKWYELIPVLSFVVLGAKCSGCHKTISWQYPVVELATGWLFLIFSWYFEGFLILEILYLLLLACFVFIFVFDLKYYLVVDSAVYLAVALALLIVVIEGAVAGQPIINHFVGALSSGILAGGFFAILVGVSKEKWMGKGDIGVGFLIGFLASWPQVLVVLLLSFWLGGLVGIVLLITKKRKLSGKVPFTPFLLMASLIVLFWNHQIMSLYEKLF